jgi:type IV fimbrial biogenesis protein FimT
LDKINHRNWRFLRSFSSGYSLVEIIIVIALIVILTSIAIPFLLKFIKYNKYQNYCNTLELLIKEAKITAIEKSTNIGVCVDNEKTVKIIDMGAKRLRLCDGTPIKIFQIDPGDTFVKFKGSGAAFDPRGFVIFSGNVCVYNSERNTYFLVCISNFGRIRIVTGEGDCGNCPQED